MLLAFCQVSATEYEIKSCDVQPLIIHHTIPTQHLSAGIRRFSKKIWTRVKQMRFSAQLVAVIVLLCLLLNALESFTAIKRETKIPAFGSSFEGGLVVLRSDPRRSSKVDER